jgi:hypothetical protein
MYFPQNDYIHLLPPSLFLVLSPLLFVMLLEQLCCMMSIDDIISCFCFIYITVNLCCSLVLLKIQKLRFAHMYALGHPGK